MKTNVIDLLEARGFIDNTTSKKLNQLFKKPQGVYIGFDPTAPSLHIGNLVGIIALGWFQKMGHKPYALAGGATGFIGDPTGKSSQRPYLDPKTLEKNLVGISKNLHQICCFNPQNPVTILNNFDWHHKMSYLDFLRDVAQHARISVLLARETVKERLKSGEGMSFKEFSYPLLQAYDFYHLRKNLSVVLQLGGSDQWTNITAGIDLTYKLMQKEVYGLTFPLLVKNDGRKFGKSESGAVWLSKEMLSPYDFYQYLYRTADEDVINLLRMLTFIPIEEIKEIETSMKSTSYKANEAQKILAKEVTKIVHGEKELEIALKVTDSMKPGSDTELNLNALKKMSENIPHIRSQWELAKGHKLVDFITTSDLVTSKGEARRLIKNGGMYLNNERIEDESRTLNDDDLVEGECLLLGFGKKKKTVVFFS